MLVLGRKLGDEIQIGEDVRVVIVAMRGNQVRLGFEAPPEVSIRRGEVNRTPRAQTRTPSQSRDHHRRIAFEAPTVAIS